MLKSKTVYNYYFSGTGNTEAIVKHFSEQLKKHGIDTHIRKMEENNLPDTEEDWTLGLIFPVAIQSTYPFVWDFIINLPDGSGRDVFMLDTMEYFSGGIVGPLKKMLTEKGYNCIGAKEFRMSSSMNTSAERKEKGSIKNSKALKQAEKYAHDLCKGKTKWKRIPLLSDWMRSISASAKIWESMSRKISVSDKCILCRLCDKNCPVKAIEVISEKIIIDHTKCNSCMRCLANCPKKAILLNNKELELSESSI